MHNVGDLTQACHFVFKIVYNYMFMQENVLRFSAIQVIAFISSIKMLLRSAQVILRSLFDHVISPSFLFDVSS